MFTTISWSTYVITVGVLLFLWYLFLILKFYSVELKQHLTGEKKIIFPTWKNPINSNSAFDLAVTRDSENSQDFAISDSAATLEDFDELSVRLSLTIEQNASENMSSASFQNLLKFILSEYPFVKTSSLRQKVNTLIVSECAKHPHLLLTYEEVNLLWEETIS